MAQARKTAQTAGAESETDAAASTEEREGQDAQTAGDGGDGDLDASAPEAPLEEQLEAAEQEAEMYKDRFLRARADLENYRKRSVQFIAEGVRDAQKQTFEAILPVVDNLERAVAYQEEHQANAVDDLLTGVRMTLVQFHDVLERHEVKRIAALGEPFDPRYHEAVEVQPVADGAAAGTFSLAVPAPRRAAGDLILTPGMPVEVHLQTEERSPISYLAKPLTDYFLRAFREE